MSVTCSRKTKTCIVNHHRTKNDFIASVHIDVGNGVVVETVTKPRRTTIVAVPAPELSQFVSLFVYTKCTELMTCICSTSEEDARIASIKVRGTEIVLLHTVTQIAPYISITLGLI